LKTSSTSNSSSDQDPHFVHRAFSSIAHRYVLTNHILSAGIDIFWRKKVARLLAGENPKIILDVATGSGDLAMAVAKGCPEAKIIGADFCAPMLECAQKRGLTDLIVADGMNLPFASDSFDALTIGYGLRNMENWAGAISEFSRVIRPGGKLVVLDFSLPVSKWLRGPYRFYLHRILPLIAGALTGNREAYAYLGDSIERFPSGRKMVELIESNGFRDARSFSLMGGISSIYFAEKKS